MRRPSSRTEALARRERRYAGAKAAEQVERARRAREAERPDISGNMGAGGDQRDAGAGMASATSPDDDRRGFQDLGEGRRFRDQ